MQLKPVTLGEMFHKAGRPRTVWTVERFSADIGISHVVLARVDDPTTQITISTQALSNPQYFCRSQSCAI